jgi:hypothetical protein
MNQASALMRAVAPWHEFSQERRAPTCVGQTNGQIDWRKLVFLEEGA